MSSSLVVEYLDEVEEGHLGLAATEEMLPKLVLDRGEPALDDGVVVLPPSSVATPCLNASVSWAFEYFDQTATNTSGPRGRSLGV